MKAFILSMLITVIGSYSHETISGQFKTCYYDTVYGQMAWSTRALSYCPLTMRFEI